MADTFGATELPLQIADTGEVVGDPGLSRLGAYLQAWLNAELSTAWQTVKPTSDPVKKVHIYDPTRFGFNEADLPALYLYRSGGVAFDWLAADYDIAQSNVQVLWILPQAPQATQIKREPIIGSVHKEIVHAIETGRHPAYVWADDPDPKAPTLGSVIYRVAGLFAVNVGTWDVGTIQIRFPDGAQPLAFERLALKLDIQEQRSLDLEKFDLLDSLDLDIRDKTESLTTSAGRY